MSWQVDPPGQGGCAAQHLQKALSKEALHQVAVGAQHAGMMDAYAGLEQLLHLSAPQETYEVQTHRSGKEVSAATYVPLRHTTQQQQQQQQRDQQQYNTQQYVSCAYEINFLQLPHRCRQIRPADDFMSWFTCCRAWQAAAISAMVQSWLVMLMSGVMSSRPRFILTVSGNQFTVHPPLPPVPPQCRNRLSQTISQ